jgi:hypothetical protein
MQTVRDRLVASSTKRRLCAGHIPCLIAAEHAMYYKTATRDFYEIRALKIFHEVRNSLVPLEGLSLCIALSRQPPPEITSVLVGCLEYPLSTP